MKTYVNLWYFTDIFRIRNFQAKLIEKIKTPSLFFWKSHGVHEHHIVTQYVYCLCCSVEGCLYWYTSDSSTEGVQNFAVLHQLHVGCHICMNISKKAVNFVLVFVYWERTWVEFMRFALLTVASVKTEPYSAVDNNHCCRGICCLHLQGRTVKMEVADSCDTGTYLPNDTELHSKWS